MKIWEVSARYGRRNKRKEKKKLRKRTEQENIEYDDNILEEAI